MKWFMCQGALSADTRNTKEYKDEAGSRKSLPFRKVFQEGRVGATTTEATKQKGVNKRYFGKFCK